MMSIDKFCINCKWHIPAPLYDNEPGEFDKCVGPQIGVNPVTGSPARAYCSVQRLNKVNNACGPEGDNFEAKEVIDNAVPGDSNSSGTCTHGVALHAHCADCAIAHGKIHYSH